ncbi:MAG TPA: S41 family peptidase [Polyangiaceae bacterium]
MVRRGVLLLGAVFGVVTGLLWVVRPDAPGGLLVVAGPPAASLASASSSSGSAPEDGAGAPADDARSHAFRVPSGEAPGLSCDAARAVVAQARTQLAYPPEPIDARAFADAAADWLDPYGLWSVAPDTPIAEAFDARAVELLADVESRGRRDCGTARELGGELVAWVDELRGVFDEARLGPAPGEDAAEAASTAAFEGATVTRPARSLAATLGRRIGVLERELGAGAHPYVDAARARYFPALDADAWARVILASAVRAYVPTIDPHGAWAPLDEESSVYEVDLEARPPSRLWDKSERTAVGVRIASGATPPLADGDVVLSLAGLPTAALSFEQAEQLGFAASEARPPAQAVVLRAGERQPVTTWLDGATAEAKSSGPVGAEDDGLPVERLEYGDGDAVIVAIHDVRDDLGDELTRALLHERERDGRPVTGVVLDLRGNGGGSTDGAIDALGLFIPGASLFPMKRRDGSLETDHAPEPPTVDRWRGPVASLVDADTASAAEMIAGALAAYRRGPTVGATTFGKGCAQEYVDDDAHSGVLRLTTLLYALPDGTAVQRVGLAPTIRFPFGAADANDRESALAHAPPTWRGPDVRDRAVLAHADDGTWAVTWPPSGGNVGPCRDADVCRALRLLAAAPATARRTPPAKGR